MNFFKLVEINSITINPHIKKNIINICSQFKQKIFPFIKINMGKK